MPVITPMQALIMGIVEGITEYLPISSTGHLVITAELLGLTNLATMSKEQIEAVQAFEIVIQGGAILAVLGLYRKRVSEVCLGLLGRSESGRRLLINMICATAPVLAIGFGLKDFIASHLQHTAPVLIALVIGGLVMLGFERFWKRSGNEQKELQIDDLSWKQALSIGFIQCLALWPGTSRSMVTIIGGMALGLRRPVAAEFSFLIGLPALLAATIYKAGKSGDVLVEHVGFTSLSIGFATSALCAALAIKWLVGFLNRRGLAAFGVYRLCLALAIFLIVGV